MTVIQHHNPMAAEIGRQMRKFRDDAGMSTMEVVRKLGWSHNRVTNIESGRNTPRLETILELLWFYDVGEVEAEAFFCDLMREDMRRRAVRAA